MSDAHKLLFTRRVRGLVSGGLLKAAYDVALLIQFRAVATWEEGVY
jgi:hypothetical protein